MSVKTTASSQAQADHQMTFVSDLCTDARKNPSRASAGSTAAEMAIKMIATGNMACTNNHTVPQKKRANFEMVQLKILRIDFGDIWQTYSEYSRIEFACFSFHVCLLFNRLFIFQTGHRNDMHDCHSGSDRILS